MDVRISSIQESRRRYASRMRVSLVRTCRNTASASTLAMQIKTSRAKKPNVSKRRSLRNALVSGTRSLVYRTLGRAKYRPEGIARSNAMRFDELKRVFKLWKRVYARVIARGLQRTGARRTKNHAMKKPRLNERNRK